MNSNQIANRKCQSSLRPGSRKQRWIGFESLESRLALTLVGHWAFDDDNGDNQADDSSGNSNHGTIQGPSFVTGQAGLALDFDGTDDFVDLNNLDVSGGELSIAGWINADSFLGSYRDGRIISKASGAGTQDHYWMISTIRQGSDTRLRFRLKTAGTTDTLVASSGNINTGQWHHIAATYGNGFMRIYLDGIAVGSRSKSGSVDVNPAVDAYIGSNPVVNKPFDGQVDDVRIYDHELTQQDIQSLISGANNPPAITSNGGGSTASVNAAEGQTAVTDVQATDDNDSEASGLTYSLTGGADQAFFVIDANTGVLTFLTAPDFGNPLDAGNDNVYDVQVTVTDSGSLTDFQDISVTVTEVIGTPGLVGHWAFDDDNGDNQADDSSGNGNHGTIQGASFLAGQVGLALDFDGVNDYVDLNNLDVSGSAISIAGWINADSFLGTYRDARIISKATGTATQDHYWMISTIRQGSDTRLRFRLKAGGTTHTLVAGSGDLLTDQWYHIAATYDGSMMRLYLDGVEIGSRSQAGPIDTNAAVEAYIGNNPVTSKPFDGTIDDVRIYESTLSPQQIQGLIGANTPPTITSDGGGETASVNAAENQSGVTNVESIDDNDSEGAGLTYSLTGGADQAFFTIDANTGVLTFQSPPDFETPLDAGADNVYDVQVTVTDSGSLTDAQDIAVTVTDVVESGSISDDFSSGVLGPAWTFTDPVGDATLSFEGAGSPHAFLKIAVPEGSEHDAWSMNSSARVMRPISDTDFELETKFESVSKRAYQSQGILVEQDADNYLRFDTFFNGGTLVVYAASIINASATTRIAVPVTLSGSTFLRVTRSNDLWTLSYSDDGQNWNSAGSFTQSLSANRAGLFAGNCCGANSPAFIAVFDYFFDNASPIVPEDGTANVPPQVVAPPADVVVAENSTPVVIELADAFLDLDPADSLTVSVQANSDPGLVTTSLVGTTLTLSFVASTVGSSDIVLRATDPGGLFVENSLTVDVHGAGPPVIDVWYGPNQDFGQLGSAQVWANILGNVWDADGVASLSYTLNGGSSTTLSMGPDGERLESAGDFNVDIALTSLQVGANQIVITATDVPGNTSVSNVTLNYSPGNTWPLPTTVDWDTVTNPQDVAQVTDGKWDSTGSAPDVRGYDRLLAIGDVTWDDYEVEVPVTIGEADFSSNNCNCNAVGFVMRWQGHLVDGQQPSSGVYNFGALTLYRWDNNGDDERLWMASNGNTVVINDDTGRELMPGLTYVFKARVESTPAIGGAFYSFKVWRQGDVEPGGWDMTMQTSGEGTDAGSLLLLSHYTNATFGTVNVSPLSSSAMAPVSSSLRVNQLTEIVDSVFAESVRRANSNTQGRGFLRSEEARDLRNWKQPLDRPEWDSLARLENNSGQSNGDSRPVVSPPPFPTSRRASATRRLSTANHSSARNADAAIVAMLRGRMLTRELETDWSFEDEGE